jgi:SSS family solute:Na+ symporter
MYPSEMAQNFWTAIFAFWTCLLMTLLVSLATRPRDPRELVGLVYSLTERQTTSGMAWYARPATLGAAVLAVALVLNLLFW